MLTIPTFAGCIVESGGTGSYSRNMTNHANKVGGVGAAAIGAQAGNAGASFKKAGDAASASGMINRSFKK